jgi:cell fate regulator YaaT (PSP1 superfamily)
VIKSDKKFSQTDDDNEEIQLLKEQIKEAERLNEKIKTENLELRLQKVKLSSDSTTMQILSLRKEIKDLRKKI